MNEDTISTQVPSRLSASLPADGRPLAVFWVLACATAELIGMGLAAGAFGISAAIGSQGSFSAAGVQWLTYGLAVAAGVGEGLALGIAQGIVLKARLPRMDLRRFILVMVMIGAVGWAIGMLPSTLSAGVETDLSPDALLDPGLPVVLGMAALLGAAGGIVIGLAQALVLRHATRGGLFKWVVLNSCGWALAFVVIFVGASTLPAEAPLIAMLLVGALTGLTAGAALGLTTLPAFRSLAAG